MKAAIWRKGGLFSFAAAMLIASATMPMAARAENIEVTTNGVTWRFTIPAPNGAAGSAMIGINTAASGTTNRDTPGLQAITDASASVDASLIPWRFDYEGTTYTVTTIGLAAFRRTTSKNVVIGATLTGTLTIPDSVTEVRHYAFCYQSLLTGFGGGANVRSWGSSALGSNAVGEFPEFSQATYFWDSVFTDSILTGPLKFGDLLTSVRYGAFHDCMASGTVVIPTSVNTLGADMGTTWCDYGVFWKCANLEAVWIKGKPTAAEQTYTTVYAASLVRECPAMKMVLIGRNTKGASINGTKNTQRMLYGDTGVQLFVPANGYWNGLDAGGTNCKTWWYSPTNDFDLVVNDEAMTATVTPNTVEAFVNALAWAPDFKTHFNLDTHINVTNALDMTGVTISEGDLQSVTFDRLVFSVTSQSQLQGLLDVFPAEVPFGIDPTGLTENITVPAERVLYVKSGEEYMARKSRNNFVISVR